MQLAMAASSLSPHTGEGKSDGFYVVGPGPQNILPRLGLLPGDLIMGMDGVHLQNPEDTEELFEKFADGGEFFILVQRGDRIQNLHLVIN
jgi:type II secretory pathway component PulC